MRFALLFSLALALLSLAFAPAPQPRRPRGPAVVAVVVAPSGDLGTHAARLRSLESVKETFDLLPATALRGKTADWVHARLSVEEARYGEGLRLTLSDYDPWEEADAVALLHALVQKHVADRVPKRKQFYAQVTQYLRKLNGGRELDEPTRDAIRKYTDTLREVTRQEEDAIVLQQPTAVRRRR